MGKGHRHSARLLGAALLAVAACLVLLTSPLMASEGDSHHPGSLPARHAPTSRHPVAVAIRATDRAPRPATAPAPRQIDTRITVSRHARSIAIPPSFLGVSTEYWALPRWSRHLRLLERVLSLVHGPGPLVLRVGGDSADWAVWSRRRHAPAWEYEITPRWLREVAAIVRRTGARLILDLNNVTATPAVAARWARAAQESLPRHSIIGLEIGNEPDVYGPWVFPEKILGGPLARRLPQTMSPGDYAEDFALYARALARVAPRVPLLGPALAEPAVDTTWIPRLLQSPHPGLRELSVHSYPYSACADRSDPDYPTIARVLSSDATTGMAQSLRPIVAEAESAGLRLRLTELNSVTCGGVRGISNTFATALWAPDALFSLLRAGVDGVNIHVRARAVNAAFSIGRRGVGARPLLYGMIAFTRMLGPHARLVALRLRAVRRRDVVAWAVRSGPTLRVLVIDKGPRASGVALEAPSGGGATVQRLLAPSVRSTRGVTLGGQWMGPDGLWRGRPVAAPLPHRGGGYVLQVPGYSAAIIDVAPR